MRVSAISADAMDVVLATLTRENRAVCRVCLETGLRVTDALALKSDALTHASTTIREHKTGKRRKIALSQSLKRELAAISGYALIFEGRIDRNKPRTRQAVFKDLKRAQKLLRLDGNVGTHSMRKSYAVRKYAACGDMRKVKALLNHSDEAVTALYALATEVEKNCNKIVTISSHVCHIPMI